MSTLTITGIQSTLHWEDKKANLQMFEGKNIFYFSTNGDCCVCQKCSAQDLVCNRKNWLETMEGETMQWMKQVAATEKNYSNRESDKDSLSRGETAWLRTYYTSPGLGAAKRAGWTL